MNKLFTEDHGLRTICDEIRDISYDDIRKTQKHTSSSGQTIKKHRLFYSIRRCKFTLLSTLNERMNDDRGLMYV